MKSLSNSFITLLLYVDDMLIAGGCKQEIDKLKKELFEEFTMKKLGAVKQIFGMRITRSSGVLRLSWEEYVKKVLSRFSMSDTKPVSNPLVSHFKLSNEQSPITEQERDHMAKVPYAFAIGSLMYVIFCTR